MKHIIALITLLTLTAPASADALDDRIRNGETWVRIMSWVSVCTGNPDGRFAGTEDERLRMCLIIEQEMRDQGHCMYSPGVIGIWTGKHCR